MTNKIKFTSGYHNLKLFIFFLYNLTYVMYMLGHISRSVNLALLIFFIFMCMFEYFKVNGFSLKKSTPFLYEFKAAMIIVVSFIGISLVIQIMHLNFQTYLFQEILYNLIPPLLAFFWLNTTKEKERYTYFFFFLIRCVGYFIFNNIGHFSIKNIIAISWFNSKSSLFEMPIAHDFLFLEIIFLCFGRKKLALICMMCCMLSLKRVSFILSGMIFILTLIFENRSEIRRRFENGLVSKRICWTVIVIMCIVPFIAKWMITDAGIMFFQTNFNIDLNEFTTGRINIMRYVVNNIPYFNGYGSTDHFMEKSSLEAFRILGSMHCDALKLYVEVTIIGVFIYFYEMVKIARKNYVVFFMLMYLFVEIICSHFIDVLSTWNLFFMFMATMYARPQQCNSEENVPCLVKHGSVTLMANMDK